MDEPIYYSYSGKGEDRILHGIHVTESKAELRRRAIMLWYDIRQRQMEAGGKATAAVWAGNSRVQPTKQEIEDYEQSVRQSVSVSSAMIAEISSESQEEEPIHNESAASDESAPDVVADDEGSDAPEPPAIVLDDDDDLDF